MNDDICKKILQFLSNKLTGKAMKIINRPYNRISVYFGDSPLYYNARIYETNGLHKQYARILSDIIQYAAKSPINIAILIHDKYGQPWFQPVIQMKTTFEQLLVQMDLSIVE